MILYQQIFDIIFTWTPFFGEFLFIIGKHYYLLKKFCNLVKNYNILFFKIDIEYLF